jgi:hypothetical protein
MATKQPGEIREDFLLFAKNAPSDAPSLFGAKNAPSLSCIACISRGLRLAGVVGLCRGKSKKPSVLGFLRFNSLYCL